MAFVEAVVAILTTRYNNNSMELNDAAAVMTQAALVTQKRPIQTPR